VVDSLIATNPASKAHLPRVPKAEQRFLSVDEVRRLSEATPAAYRSMVAVGVACGLRIGELVPFPALCPENHPVSSERTWARKTGGAGRSPARGASPDCVGQGWRSWQASWFRRLEPG